MTLKQVLHRAGEILVAAGGNMAILSGDFPNGLIIVRFARKGVYALLATLTEVLDNARSGCHAAPGASTGDRPLTCGRTKKLKEQKHEPENR